MGLIICKWNEKYTGTLEGEEDEGTKWMMKAMGRRKCVLEKKRGWEGKERRQPVIRR